MIQKKAVGIFSPDEFLFFFFFWYDSCLNLCSKWARLRLSSPLLLLTVSGDSRKVFLKKRKGGEEENTRRGHSRQPDEKICRPLWCLCVKWLIALSTRRPFRITHFKKRKRNGSFLQKRQTLTFLFSTSVTVATSEMSEMSFALKKDLPQTFKGTLDCFNVLFIFYYFKFFWLGGGFGLLMISSQLFVFPPPLWRYKWLTKTA